MKYATEKDFYFMQGFRAAEKAYKENPEYETQTKTEIKMMGLKDTWSEYSEYNFANYLDLNMPEEREKQDYIYDGIKAAMDCFFLNCYMEVE